jgi:hypothetical protein
MSKLLRTYLENFTPSKAVFKVIARYADTLDTELVERVKTELDHPANGILQDSYREYFNVDTKKMEISIEGTVQSTMNIVIGKLISFFRENSRYKDPTSTKLYKFLVRLDPASLSDHRNDGFLMLYKYTKTFCDDGMKCDHGHLDNAKQVQTVLDILDLIRQKMVTI